MKNQLHKWIEEAKAGDQQALEQVLFEIQDLVYNLSLKFLLFPEDAKDATQEVLIRVVTHLSTFQFQSKFSTWVYRIATNYLIDAKEKKAKEFAMPFKDYARLIDSGQSKTVRYTRNEGELALLEEEVKVSCTQGLLLCLNPTDRLVYIIAEILNYNGKEGAEIMGLSHDNFRKKLSRSRHRIRNFLHQKCGLANPQNPCRCAHKIDFLIDQKNIDPKQLKYAQFTKRSIDLVSALGELEKSVAIYRSTPQIQAPEEIMSLISATLNRMK